MKKFDSSDLPKFLTQSALEVAPELTEELVTQVGSVLHYAQDIMHFIANNEKAVPFVQVCIQPSQARSDVIQRYNGSALLDLSAQQDGAFFVVPVIIK